MNNIDKKEWKNFPLLENEKELDEYITKRIVGHNRFYHYTSLKNINSILGENTLYFSSIKRLNDAKEQVPFCGEENRYYSFCFSTGKNENLSLWYLYSGIDGKGGRISLTYNKTKALLESSEYTLWECNEYFEPIEEVKKLTIDTDMNITLRDILYAHVVKDSSFCDLKYNTMTNYNRIKKKELEKYCEKYKGFVKGLIWYSEKETRLLIRLNDNVFNMLNSEKTYLIKVKFPEKMKKEFQLQFAPEITDIDDVINNKEYSKVREFVFHTSKVKYSEYKGDIQMRLCNKERIKEEICSTCDYKKGEKI